MKTKILSTYCLSCKQDTRQAILHTAKGLGESVNKEQELDILEWEELYMIIRCAGCHTTSFLRRTIFHDMDEKGEITPLDENFPGEEQPFNFLSEEDLAMLPASIRKVYFEVRSSFSKDLEILSGIGLRVILEAVCIDQKIPGKNLAFKITGLQNKGFISANEYPILDKLRVIGNVAAHQIKGLRIEILSYALDIMNHVLTSIYILPKINKRIKV